MRYVFLLLLQFFLSCNTLAKETVSDRHLSIYLDSLKNLQRDYQITGYNLYKFLGKNSPVRNSAKKRIDKYFGINTELLGTLNLIINKKEYPSLYLAAEEPFYPSDFWGDSDNNFDEESASGEPFYSSDFWGNSHDDFDEESASDAETLVAENAANPNKPNKPNAAASVNGAQQPENPEEENENEEDQDDENEEDGESDENAGNEEEATQPQPVSEANPQSAVEAINPQSAVEVNPQLITDENQQSDDADQLDADQPDSDQLPLMENLQQYQGDVFTPTDDLLGSNLLLPSMDNNFPQYQGDLFTPNNNLIGQTNIESAAFQSDNINGNWGNQNNRKRDQLGNLLRKAQLAKNTFIGDLDRYGNAYGNAYDNEYYEGQGNSGRKLRQTEIENVNMNSDNINYRESDSVNEAQVFGENQAENNQLQDNSVTHSDNSDDINVKDSREGETQPATADNNSPNSEPAENSSTQTENVNNNAENSSIQKENTNNSVGENSINDTDAASLTDSANDENLGADTYEEDEKRAVSESSYIAQIARQTQQASSFVPQPGRFVGQFVPQTQIPQQNTNFLYADQSDYDADSESYDDSNPSENTTANLRINSQNTQISDSDAKTQSISDEEDGGNHSSPSEMIESEILNHEDSNAPSDSDKEGRGNRSAPSEMIESEIVNHADSSRFLNGDRVESTVNETSSDPRYLNEFDEFADSQSQDSAISGESEISVVQSPKKLDDEPILIPDTSDGKLHINHF